MKPTVLPITIDYMAMEFLLPTGEALISGLHPYAVQRIAMRIDTKIIDLALAGLAEQGIIEIKDATYRALKEVKPTLIEMYKKWGEEWETLVKQENEKLILENSTESK